VARRLQQHLGFDEVAARGEREIPQQGDGHDPVARLAVLDFVPGHSGQDPAADLVRSETHRRNAVLRVHSRADHEVLARPGRGEKPGKIVRVVLPVRVDECDVGGVARQDRIETGPQRAPLAAVRRAVDHLRAGARRLEPGGIRGAVVDDDDLSDVTPEPAYDVADGGGGLVRRHQGDGMEVGRHGAMVAERLR
jgi:hypothetical protein